MLWVNGLLLALLVLSVVGCTLLGPVRLDLSQALANIFSANPDAEILFRARLPRVLLGVAIGGGMAACGVVLQALLRNPLACPQMIGVSGGASLGGILGLIEIDDGIQKHNHGGDEGVENHSGQQQMIRVEPPVEQ